MGNWLNKPGDNVRIGTSKSKGEDVNEANNSKSRCINTLFNGEVKPRNIYEHETAQEFLESCCGDQHRIFEVVLHCFLNRQIVLERQDEISDHWDDVDYICIVLVGNGENKDIDTTLLDPAIKLRTK